MIVEALLNLIVGFVEAVLGVLGVLPDMPQAVISVLDQFLNIIYQGINIAAFFSPWSLMMTILGLVVAIEVFFEAFTIIKWILTKVPVLHWSA